MNRYLIAILFLLLFIPIVGAWNCQIKETCGTDEIKILALSNLTNAHAENYTQINYQYSLCCENSVSRVSVTSDCKGTRYSNFDYIVNLSAGTNAHLSLPNETISYPNPICIGLYANGWNASGSSAVHCFANETCNDPYTTMLSLSATTNAHGGNGSAYPLKVCCKLDPDVTGPLTYTIDAVNGSTYGSPFTFHLSCIDNETGYEQSGCAKTWWCTTRSWSSSCIPNTLYVNNITLTNYTTGSNPYRVMFRSQDNAGNNGSIYDINLTISTDLPNCVLELSTTQFSPGNTNQTILKYNWSVANLKSDDFVTNWTLRWAIGNVSNGYGGWNELNFTNPENNSWNLTGSNGQKFYVQCRANTNLYPDNTVWSSPSIVFVDTQPPTASISLPQYITIPTDPGNFTVTWSGEDGNGSGIYQYELQNSTVQSNCSNNTGWSDWLTTNKTEANFTGRSATKYYFRVRAIDRAGNVGNWSCSSTQIKGIVQINITLENVNGTIRTGQNLTKLGQNVSVKVSAYAQIGIKDIDIIYSNATVLLINKTNTTNYWNISWKVTPNQTGNYTITINLTDIANDSIYSHANFTVVECFAAGNWTENKSCGTDVGECIAGLQYCLNESLTWSECEGGIGPTEEICNDNLDTDCDGDSSQNEPDCITLTCSDGQTRPCAGLNTTWQFSKCYGGVQTCYNNSWGPCSKSPGTEICNELDDNCNGELNEGLGASCCSPNGAIRVNGDSQLQALNGTGVCRVGIDQCNLSKGGWVKIQEKVPFSTDDKGVRTELAKDCNDGKDNDCDGLTDGQDPDCGFILGGLVDFWYLFIAAGGAILAIVLFLFFKFRARGEELTWENLMKHYGG